MGYEEKASEPSKEIEEQVEAVKEQAKEVYREARPWLVKFARLGTGAKGVVYLALGILILRAVGGAGSPEVDQRTTFQTIDNQFFLGPLLLALIATGLAGYVLWMFAQAVVDPHGHGTNPRGLIRRGIMIVVVGLFLIHSAIRYNLEQAGGLGDVLRTLARQPYGPWILAAIATGLVAFGIYTIILVRYGRFNV